MALANYTHFCCRSGGSNLNAGTLLGDTTEPGTSPSFAYNGTFSTNTFTVTSGAQVGSTTNPQADGVTAGMFVQVSNAGSSLRLARINSVTTTTIVLDATATAGTGTGATLANVGGAWAGPSGTNGFPWNTWAGIDSVLASGTGFVRLNLKNDKTYSITGNISANSQDPQVVAGYTTSYGDEGRATIDGGTSGASYELLTIGASSPSVRYEYINFQNNGATGSANGVSTAGNATTFFRCVFSNFRGRGLSATGASTQVVECEAYACNASNTATTGGFHNTGSTTYKRCISHDNTGNNSSGFYGNGGMSTFDNCIADTNGAHGFLQGGACFFSGCDSYNNGGSGLSSNGANLCYIESCNFFKNTAWGIAAISTNGIVASHIHNCSFGAGTQVNGSGTVQAGEEYNSTTYANDTHPWTDPANGDFRLVAGDTNSNGTGRGTFLETAASYAGTVGYPDRGSAQHLESAAGGGLLHAGGMTGGMQRT